ncbi:hypothetical protein CEUSTIGMA_g2609.t1 [Chlamydomonas eustigma]|uniref:Uncharacterized protein n=1 Tax=Chlamydomonas eustigma TaxID=1157962 RepID=A0A250WWJ6_9CHLO|nr:hypothetical protein CEUSTIGMA_g2609.t1 [Chlamydomonas eustigma]|eukprot:GAX75165.1 hypothetical protein CEUSTIGMA_g2609.t1 [Chlamydomonas eustigma]
MQLSRFIAEFAMHRLQTIGLLRTCTTKTSEAAQETSTTDSVRNAEDQSYNRAAPAHQSEAATAALPAKKLAQMARDMTYNTSFIVNGDRSYEEGMVAELGRRQDYHLELLLAKRRLDLKMHPPMRMSLLDTLKAAAAAEMKTS